MELRTFGTLSVRGPDGFELDALLAQPKRIALLSYLCLATPRGFHRRDTLVGLFSPESDEAHARGALRKALHVLRRAVGDDVILSRGEEEVGVDFHAISCDAVAFQDHVECGRLEDAMALYRGDLLPGFFLSEVPEFEQWLERERARLRGLAARVAHGLADQLESSGRLTDAVRVARTAVELADTDERALRHLLELLDRVGDRTGAIAAHEEFARRVAASAGVEPSAETQELVRRIRVRRADVHIRDPGAVREDGDPGASTLGGRSATTRRDQTAAHDLLEQRATRQVAAVRFAERTKGLQFRLAAIVILALLVGGSVFAFRTRSRIGEFVGSGRQITFAGNIVTASFSPDGQFLAYAVPRGDSEVVVVQDVGSGGRPDTLAEVYRVITLEWSPDATRLLVGAPGQALIIARAGGPVRRMWVPALGRPRVRAYWLPTGERISVHIPTHRQIYLVDLTTNDTVSVPVGGSYTWLMSGSWSPDGRAFAVVTASSSADSSTLRVVTIGGRTDALVEDSVKLSSPRWSPAGDSLYYVRADQELWRVPLRLHSRKPRGAPEKISDQLDLIGPLEEDPIMTLTRDGRFTYVKGDRFSNLWLIEPGASGWIQRSLTTGTLFRWGAAVSPDGRWLAFAQETPEGAEVFRAPFAGGAPQQLTFGARVRPLGDIAWSPDGSELVFRSERSGRLQLWVAQANDGRMRLLERTSASSYRGHLAWAPSRHIVYQTHDHGALNLVDPVAGDEHTLVTESGGGFASPRFSADGQQLAFRVGSRVAVLSLGDSSMRTVALLEHWPRSWSSDGRYIYSQDYRSIHRLDTRGVRPPELITTLPWRNAQCSPIGPHRPMAFVCTAFEYVSDVWTMERTKATTH